MDILNAALNAVCYLLLALHVIGILLLNPIALTAILLHGAKKTHEESEKRYRESEFCRMTGITWNQMTGNRGIRGEYEAYETLKRFAADGARFLFNLYIPSDNGGTTEIDLLMLTTRGIFVVESKNMAGEISGSAHAHDWTQTLRRSSGELLQNAFYSPIRQNAGHIHHLRRLVGERVPLYSLIVFSNLSKLHVDVPAGQVSVVRRCEAASAVQLILQRAPRPLTSAAVDALYQRLLPYTRASSEVKRRHLERLAAQAS